MEQSGRNCTSSSSASAPGRRYTTGRAQSLGALLRYRPTTTACYGSQVMP